jgi:antirestriction protein ArdC
MPSKPDVYTRVTDKIIADLERGTLTWQQPWQAAHQPWQAAHQPWQAAHQPWQAAHLAGSVCPPCAPKASPTGASTS